MANGASIVAACQGKRRKYEGGGCHLLLPGVCVGCVFATWKVGNAESPLVEFARSGG